MTYPPQPDPYDPTRGFPAPQPYHPGQAVVSGPPGQPYPPGPYPQPGQQYGTPPPGPHPHPGFYPPPGPPKKGWSTGKIVAAAAAAIFVSCLSAGALGTMTDAQDKTAANTAVGAAAAETKAAKPTKAKEPAKPKPAEPEPVDDETPQFDLKVGTALTVTDGASVQDVTLTSFKFRKSCGGLSAPKSGGYLVVDIKATQKSGTGSINPLYFKFVGADGTTADTLSGMFSGCEKNSLDATNSLRAGQKRAGQIVFDVGSAKGAVEMTPGLFSDSVGSWKLG